jgi:GNAT superfamily N-acetyltransferase
MTGPSARRGVPDDIDDLVALYDLLAAEMLDLRPDWAATSGLREPVDDAVRAMLEGTIVGLFDDVPVGFLFSTLAPPTCTISYVYTRPEVRGVGVGEAMVDLLRGEAGALGIKTFDVPVLPGHRAAKNFFEGEGFKARQIIMRHNV